MTATASKVKETKDKVTKQESSTPAPVTQEERKLNVYEKLVEVRKTITSFTKDAKAGEGRYEYVSGSQVLKAIKEEMDNQGLILQPLLNQKTLRTTRGTKKTKYGESRIFTFEGLMGYLWINAENPKDKYFIPWYLTGEQDDPSKAFGSALTYAERYFLLKFFGVPTDDDDPDARKPEQNQPQKPAGQQNVNRKPVNASIIQRSEANAPVNPTAQGTIGANGRKATEGQIEYIKELVKAKLGQDPDEYFAEKKINLESLTFSTGRAYIDKLKGMEDKPKEEVNEQESQQEETTETTEPITEE